MEESKSIEDFENSREDMLKDYDNVHDEKIDNTQVEKNVDIFRKKMDQAYDEIHDGKISHVQAKNLSRIADKIIRSLVIEHDYKKQQNTPYRIPYLHYQSDTPTTNILAGKKELPYPPGEYPEIKEEE